MRISLVILISCALGFSPVAAQSIFDEESAEPAAKETQAKKTKPDGEDESSEKPAKVKKKKKPKKKKKSPKSIEPGPAARADYTPEEIAKSSYAWAPETEMPALVSSAPGMKPAQPSAGTKPAAAQAGAEAIESQPAPQQKFRLPQIPLTQVLIVAGFVILFLIYRFRVGKQIKRKKY